MRATHSFPSLPPPTLSLHSAGTAAPRCYEGLGVLSRTLVSRVHQTCRDCLQCRRKAAKHRGAVAAKSHRTERCEGNRTGTECDSRLAQTQQADELLQPGAISTTRSLKPPSWASLTTRPGLPLLFSTDGMLLRRFLKPEWLQFCSSAVRMVSCASFRLPVRRTLLAGVCGYDHRARQ